MKNKIYKNEKWLIKKHCEERLSAYAIAEICEVYNGTIYNWIKKYKLKRKKTLPRRSKTRYYLNERYFEKINNSNKAYWLGFIAADGGVGEGKSKRVLRIFLSRKDRCHLEKFKKEVEYEGPIYDGKVKNKEYFYSILQICSHKMVEDLATHGIVANKTKILKRPDIDKKYYRHWIRGMFDGDGSVSILKQGYVAGEFFGTKDVMEFVVENIPGTNTVSKKKNFFGWYHSFGGNGTSKKIYDYMYKYSRVCLERKKQIFLLTDKRKYIKMLNSKCDKKLLETEYISRIFKRFF